MMGLNERVLAKRNLVSVTLAGLMVGMGCDVPEGRGGEAPAWLEPDDEGYAFVPEAAPPPAKTDFGVTTVVVLAVGVFVGTNVVYCLVDWFTRSGFWGCSAGAAEAPAVEFPEGEYPLTFASPEDEQAFIEGLRDEGYDVERRDGRLFITP